MATAALESAIAEHGSDGDAKFSTFLELSRRGPQNERPTIFGSPNHVDVLRRFSEVRTLLRIFVHETAHRFDGAVAAVGDEAQDDGNFAAQTEIQMEANFVKQTVPQFFGTGDKPQEKMSHDKMANLSVVFAGRSRIKEILRKTQHVILASHWEQ